MENSYFDTTSYFYILLHRLDSLVEAQLAVSKLQAAARRRHEFRGLREGHQQRQRDRLHRVRGNLCQVRAGRVPPASLLALLQNPLAGFQVRSYKE